MTGMMRLHDLGDLIFARSLAVADGAGRGRGCVVGSRRTAWKGASPPVGLARCAVRGARPRESESSSKRFSARACVHSMRSMPALVSPIPGGPKNVQVRHGDQSGSLPESVEAPSSVADAVGAAA